MDHVECITHQGKDQGHNLQGLHEHEKSQNMLTALHMKVPNVTQGLSEKVLLESVCGSA